MKVEEILKNEFAEEDEPDQVDFFEIGEQMESHEVTFVGPILTEYILAHYQNEFKISPERVNAIR